MSINYISVDLGTYNSSAATRSEKGSIEILKNLSDKPNNRIGLKEQIEKLKEFPSFISFNTDGSIRDIGISGKERAYNEPEYVVWGIKRLLGKTFTELKESGELDRFPYRIRPNRKNGQCLIYIGDKAYTPEHLCAEVFKKIRSEAESQQKKEFNSVIVSVPAFYDPLRVTPIIEAARIAGFDNVNTIPEPVAAALAYDIDITTKPLKLVVFDLGAGTLDVTAGLLFRNPDKTEDFQFQVLKNTGDPNLGGIDMDDRLAGLIRERYLDSELCANYSRLRRVAEIAKIRLSEEDNLEHIVLDGNTYEININQHDFRKVLEGSNPAEKNIVEECRYQVMEAIYGAGWTPQEIEVLLLIGGPTKLKCIQDLLKIVFNSNAAVLEQLEEFYGGSEKVDRMAAVSFGALLSVDRKINDKVPYGYGIEDVKVGDDHLVLKPKILIPRDTHYPYQSRPYLIQWTNYSGLFEFKILQHIPKGEIKHSGFEFKFITQQIFAVRNPNFCMVSIQMGYNENKELEVTIKNALTSEFVKYVGMSTSSSIGMSFPQKVQKPPKMGASPKRITPSQELLAEFADWVRFSAGFLRRKLDNSPILNMRLKQNLDEMTFLLGNGNHSRHSETFLNRISSLIQDSYSIGVIDHDDYLMLKTRLSDFQNELFKLTIK